MLGLLYSLYEVITITAIYIGTVVDDSGKEKEAIEQLTKHLVEKDQQLMELKSSFEDSEKMSKMKTLEIEQLKKVIKS